MDIEELMPASKLEIKYCVSWDNGTRIIVLRGMPRDYVDADGKSLIGVNDIIELKIESNNPDVEDLGMELGEDMAFEITRGLIRALMDGKNVLQREKLLFDLRR